MKLSELLINMCGVAPGAAVVTIIACIGLANIYSSLLAACAFFIASDFLIALAITLDKPETMAERTSKYINSRVVERITKEEK